MARFAKQFERLTDAVDWSGRQLGYQRSKRIEAIRHMTGLHYADNAASKAQPVNMIALAIFIYLRMLAPRSPRSMFSTYDTTMKSVATNFGLSVNQSVKEINFGNTLQELVLEALFSIATAKVGLHAVTDVQGYKYGKPFVDVVTIDNLVLDMSAKNMDSIQFVGNDYWLDYDSVMESKAFPANRKNGIDADEFELVNENGEERAESISINETADEYRKRLWMRDVYLKDEGVYVTYAVKAKRLLRDFDWPSREIKPYYHLGYGRVPGNLLPLAPVSLWRDLHELGNSLYRKMGTGADAQKNVLGFSGGYDESVEAFQGASDGDGINYKGPKPEKLSAGGVDQNTFAFFLNAKDLFSYYANNIDSLGGLAPMTQTVGQDRLLSEAANAQIRDMGGKTLDFTRDIFRALAWYDWHDPIGRRVIQREISGTDIAVPVEWGPESRTGDISVFDLDIDPYSAQDNSPSVQLQKIGMLMTQYILPLLPLIEAQGGILDVQKLMKTVTQYADVSELQDIIMWSSRDQGTGNLQQTNSPSNANEHTGQRMRGMTDKGASAVQQRLLMGDNPQQSELA